MSTLIACLVLVAATSELDPRWEAALSRWRRDSGWVLRTLDEVMTASGVRVVTQREVGDGPGCERLIEGVVLSGDPDMPDIHTTLVARACCEPGCARRPVDWVLELLRDSVEADTLSALLPARGHATVETVMVAGDTRKVIDTQKVTRRSRPERGPLVDVSCDFSEATLVCDDVAAGAPRFSCTCEGPGERVSFAWKAEREGYVLERIERALTVPVEALTPAAPKPRSSGATADPDDLEVSSAGVSIAVLGAIGARTIASVEESVSRRATGFFYCAQSEGPPPAGELLVWAHARADANVLRYTILRDTLRDEALTRCVASKLSRRWTTLADGGTGMVLRFVYSR